MGRARNLGKRPSRKMRRATLRLSSLRLPARMRCQILRILSLSLSMRLKPSLPTLPTGKSRKSGQQTGRQVDYSFAGQLE